MMQHHTGPGASRVGVSWETCKQDERNLAAFRRCQVVVVQWKTESLLAAPQPAEDGGDAEADRLCQTAAAIRFRLSALCQSHSQKDGERSCRGLVLSAAWSKTTSSSENGTIPCVKLLPIRPMTIWTFPPWCDARRRHGRRSGAPQSLRAGRGWPSRPPLSYSVTHGRFSPPCS